MKKEKIAVLGAGNLGLAIANGIVNKGLADASSVTLTKRSLEAIQHMESQGFVLSTNNREAVEEAKIVFLCVQPKQLFPLLDEIKEVLTEAHVLVSVITGVSLDQIGQVVGEKRAIVRAMPNTAIGIGESMTCLTTNSEAGEHLSKTEALFEAVGKTLVVEEELMQAATVLGASGIAFFMRYLRAATQGGVQMGFDSADAQLIAMQTAKGAASLVLEGKTHPEVEIDKVTTPQGCTIAGLNEMEHQGFSSALIQGIMTSFNRITNMKGQNSSLTNGKTQS